MASKPFDLASVTVILRPFWDVLNCMMCCGLVDQNILLLDVAFGVSGTISTLENQ